MPDDVRAMLDELERLEKAATPGWTLGIHHPLERCPRGEVPIYGKFILPPEAKPGAGSAIYPRVLSAVCSTGWQSRQEVDANAMLAVAARNALPTLLRLARRAGEMEDPPDNAPSRGRLLDIIRNAFGPKSGHGACARAAKGEKVCQICCAMMELKEIAARWKGGMVRVANLKEQGHD